MSAVADSLQKMLDEGRYAAVLQAAREHMGDPEARLKGGIAAVATGNNQAARELLENLPPFTDPRNEAERLGLLGRAYFQQGDATAYRELARRATALDQGYPTLLHLGHALPPEQAVSVFKEVLSRAETPREEGSVAYVLARILEKMGRFREGLPYASLAMLRDPGNPIVVLAYAGLTVMGSDNASWSDLTQQLEPLCNHPQREIQITSRHLLIEVQLTQGRLSEAMQQSQELLALVGKDLLPLVVWQAVRLHLQMGQRAQAIQVAQAAQLSNLTDPTFRSLTRLALGHALYPDPRSATAFTEAANLATEVGQIAPATIARLYLANLHNQTPQPHDTALLEQWSEAMRHTLPSPVQNLNYCHALHALGRAELLGARGPIPLRPRSIELLVLLVSRPEGWQREDLATALYGTDNPNAIKVELTRLKRALGGGLASNPWRVTLPLYVDFVELQHALASGDFVTALHLFQGGVLPRSQAPGIEELRLEIEHNFRRTILNSQNTDALSGLSERMPDDLEVWESLFSTLGPADPRRFAVQSRIERLRDQYMS